MKGSFYILLILIFFSVSPPISYGSDATYEKHLARGVADVESGNFRDAIKEFKAALKEKPNDPTATLYIGIAFSRLGDRQAEKTLKKALSLKPSDPRTNLELGIYYFNASTYVTARGYFDSAIKFGAGTEFAERAQEYIDRLKERGIARKWSLNMSLGGQYDSNVILNPDVGPLPQGITRKSDWRAVAFLTGRYALFSSENMDSSVGYSLYQSVHANLSDFNVSQHVVDLSATYRLSPVLHLRGTYAFEYVFVGGHGYDSAHSVGPALLISEGKGYSTVIEYRYRKERFMNSDLFFDNSDRSGSDNLVEISQNIPIHPRVTARVAYSYDVDSTREDFWHYTGNKGAARFTFSLPKRISVNVDGEYCKRDYKGISPLSGYRRKDDIYSASVSATKSLSDRYSITVGQLYVRNRSNIDDFDYKRAITSLFLNARF